MAAAVEATALNPEIPGTLEGNETRFNGTPDGDDLYITDPDDPPTDGRTGFFKRIEIRATIVPNLPDPRDYNSMFYWRQDNRGWLQVDGVHVQGSPFNDWSSDDPLLLYQDRTPSDDPNNHIQMSDAPGWDTGGWNGPADDGDHTLHYVGLNGDGAHEFRNAVLYDGKRVSKDWGDALWTRECRLYSNPQTGRKWAVNANN